MGQPWELQSSCIKSPEYASRCDSLTESEFEAVCVAQQRGLQIRSEDTKDLVPVELLIHNESVDMPLYDPQPLTQFLILSNEEVRLPERTNWSFTNSAQWL